MKEYNKYTESREHSSGAKIFKFFIKSLFIFFLCLLSYLWIQRKKIATNVIQRQLYKMDIYDLAYTVAEISPFGFELRDIAWGESERPFIYISSLKIAYTPQGLYAGSVDMVTLGGLETAVCLDDDNKPRFELMERVLLAVAHAKLEYPAKAGTAKKGSVVLPEIWLKRGTLVLREFDGSESGRLRFNGYLSNGRGILELKGGIELPTGKDVAFEGQMDVLSLDLSSFAASLKAEIDLDDMVDPALGLNTALVDVIGSVQVGGLDSSPEWELKLQVPERTYLAKNANFAFSSVLDGECEFGGSVTNVSGSGDFYLNDLRFDIPAATGYPAITNGANISLSFELSPTAIDQLDSATIDGRLDIVDIYSQADEMIDLSEGIDLFVFTLSAKDGFNASVSCSYFPVVSVMGVDMDAGITEFSVSNNAVNVKSYVSVKDEDIELMFDAVVPLADPQSGFVRIEVLPVVVDSDGIIGKLAREKSGDKFDFSGTISASLMVDGLKPGALVTGCVDVVNGSYSKKEIEVEGIKLNLPFEIRDGLQSVGAPLMTIESVKAGNLKMENGVVRLHLNIQELFVESAQIDWAKGYLRAYSIHAGLDGNIRNEFIVYADKVDLGQVFMLVMPFKGRMEGVLYGRFPVKLKKKRVELSTGYLYSLPGQGGVLKLDDPSQIEALLLRAGIKDDSKKSLSKALSDLALTTIRLDLVPGEGQQSSLQIKLSGKSNYEKRPVPVDLNLNLNGALQELLDLGMDMSGM